MLGRIGDRHIMGLHYGTGTLCIMRLVTFMLRVTGTSWHVNFFLPIMPRSARIKAENQVYSVVTRVNNSGFVFENDTVCQMFLAHLQEIKEKLKFKIYAFVLMSSHVHLLIEPDDQAADISEIMFYINGKFAQKFNLFNGRKGHFWMERFSSKLVEYGRHLANTIAYFAMNPVKAGITDNPLEFKYSSIHNLVNGSFAEILDPLPQEFRDFLEEFLKINDFVELLDKCTKIIKRFSFSLNKSKQEQRYRNFIGSSSFIAKNNQFFGLQKSTKPIS